MVANAGTVKKSPLSQDINYFRKAEGTRGLMLERFGFMPLPLNKAFQNIEKRFQSTVWWAGGKYNSSLFDEYQERQW